MTIDDLIEDLRKAKAKIGGDAEVEFFKYSDRNVFEEELFPQKAEASKRMDRNEYHKPIGSRDVFAIRLKAVPF